MGLSGKPTELSNVDLGGPRVEEVAARTPRQQAAGARPTTDRSASRRSASRLPAPEQADHCLCSWSPETHCPDRGFDLNRAEQANVHDQPHTIADPRSRFLVPDGCTAGGLDTPTHRCYVADGDGRKVASSPGSAGPRPPTDSILHAGPARARSLVHTPCCGHWLGVRCRDSAGAGRRPGPVAV